MTPDVSAVVCTHRMERWPWLLECLGSLSGQSLQPLEVVVVVDGRPEIARRLADRDGPETVVSTAAPSGLSAARNLGLAHASGRFVAFLDDDAVAETTWLQRLRAVLDDDTVAGVGGVSLPRWEGSRPGWVPEELLWTLGCSYRGMPVAQSDVRNVYGGCACFRVDIFTRFGGFNPRLGRMAAGLAGCEETELCLRVRNHSRQLRFVHEPAAVIYHRVPRDRQRAGYMLSRCLAEGRSKAALRAVTNGGAWPSPGKPVTWPGPCPAASCMASGISCGGTGWGLAQAALLLAGVMNTVAAYAAARVRGLFQRSRPVLAPAPFGPRVPGPAVAGRRKALSKADGSIE